MYSNLENIQIHTNEELSIDKTLYSEQKCFYWIYVERKLGSHKMLYIFHFKGNHFTEPILKYALQIIYGLEFHKM